MKSFLGTLFNHFAEQQQQQQQQQQYLLLLQQQQQRQHSFASQQPSPSLLFGGASVSPSSSAASSISTTATPATTTTTTTASALSEAVQLLVASQGAPDNWSTEQVVNWLVAVRLSELAPIFVENGIDGRALAFISVSHMREVLGISFGKSVVLEHERNQLFGSK